MARAIANCHRDEEDYGSMVKRCPRARAMDSAGAIAAIETGSPAFFFFLSRQSVDKK